MRPEISMNHTIRSIAGLLSLLCCVASCGKNPVKSHGDTICDHVDADGMRIVQRGATLAQQWQAGVAGGLVLDAGPGLDSVVVQFLSPDSNVIAGGTLACGDKSLTWEVADTALVAIVPAGFDPWTVRVVGKSGGTTTVRFKIFHVDHVDFTSQPIPITVHGAPPHVPVGAVRAILFQGCSRVSSWAWHIPGVYGKLVAPAGGSTPPIGMQFQRADTAYVVPDEPGYALGWTVANPAIAQVDTVPGRPWHFAIHGGVPGHTTVVFRLLWNGTTEMTTGAFDVVVEDHAAPSSMAANFLLKKSGVRYAFVRNDSLVPSCGSTPSIGFLPAKLDTIEDLFLFRLVNFANCAETTPSSAFYSLAFEFADPCMAGIVAHPEHSGEYFEFHLRGLVAGETTLRIKYLYQNTVAFTSPPIPVRVTAGGSGASAVLGSGPP
jgi:hypothetical protein